MIKKYITLFLFLIFSVLASLVAASEKGTEVNSETKLSPETQDCIGCHNIYTPGIVADWLSSRHSRITPADALKLPLLQRRISTEKMDFLYPLHLLESWLLSI